MQKFEKFRKIQIESRIFIKRSYWDLVGKKKTEKMEIIKRNATEMSKMNETNKNGKSESLLSNFPLELFRRSG